MEGDRRPPRGRGGCRPRSPVGWFAVRLRLADSVIDGGNAVTSGEKPRRAQPRKADREPLIESPAGRLAHLERPADGLRHAAPSPTRSRRARAGCEGRVRADRRPRRDQVVEQQRLHQRQRLGAAQLGADHELAEPLHAQVAGVLHALPDRLLELGRQLGCGRPGCAAPTRARAGPASARGPRDRSAATGRGGAACRAGPPRRRGARAGRRVPGRNATTMSACARCGRRNAPRRARAGRALEHLVGRVAAPRAVARELPGPPHALGRRQEDADVVRLPQRLGVEVEQPLDQDELAAAERARAARACPCGGCRPA